MTTPVDRLAAWAGRRRVRTAGTLMIVMSAAWALLLGLALAPSLGTPTSRDEAELIQWIRFLVPLAATVLVMRALLGVLVRRGRVRRTAIATSILWVLGLAWVVTRVGGVGSSPFLVGGLLFVADLAATAYVAWALLRRQPVEPDALPPGAPST